MSHRSVTHASFTIVRHWKAPPARVFQAFADESKKKAWFGGGDAWEPLGHSFDFRVGGREQESGRFRQTGMVSSFDCIYLDIVAPSSTEDGRIIYSYTMHLDDRKISCSQACIEFRHDGSGTRFVLTEYGDYLDGYDDNGSREQGTNVLIDTLAKTLEA